MKKQAHVISHSHWDREWYLPYEKHHCLEVEFMDRLLDTMERDPDFKSFHLDGQTIMLESLQLTAKELAILKKLYENRGNIVTFDILCNTVWGDEYYGYENTLMVHIRRLREKIEENPSSPEWLLTVRGLGYRLVKEQGS